jgi:hypothetical protein
MADWIEQRSAQLKTHKADDNKQAQASATVDQLENAVRRDVARWNELNPSYRLRIDGVTKLMPSGAFRVYKTAFPPASVNAVLDPDSFCVVLETTTLGATGHGPRTSRSQFMLAASKGGFCLTSRPGVPISLEEASRLLLEPILETLS